MFISYSWLQDYIKEKLPLPDEVARTLTLHSYEVEEVRERDGEIVFDIDVLPNRASDSLSHWGVAREIAALFDLTLTIPEPKAKGEAKEKSADVISLSIEDEKLVRRATKRLAVDVEIGESPDWIKKRLLLLGQKSHNNVIDITNYVMFETGQPVHAFDFDTIEGGVVIRSSKKGEKIELLDGSEHELRRGMLVIADEKKALDIAGIKGGAHSGVSENTSRLMLSVCSFDPTSIRKTSKELNVRTDASKRFENDISPEMSMIAMERLSELLEEYAGAFVTSDVVDVYPTKKNPYVTGVSLEEINTLLGTQMEEGDVENVFGRLGFVYESVNPRERVSEGARALVGVPYVYGARVSYDAPGSFDCSSLVAYLYAQAGYSVPRMSVDQYVFGRSIEKDDLMSGDLVFSNGGNGKIYYESQEYLPGTPVPEGVDHVGIYVGEGQIVHATKKRSEVVIEKLDESTRFSEIRGCRRIIEGEERFVVQIPHYRLDLRIPQDLVEEVGRIYGYENIEERAQEGEVVPVAHKTLYLIEKVRDALIDAGYSEVYLYSFRNDGDVGVRNKIASDKGYLRSNLSDGMKEALEFNISNAPLFGTDTICLFEIGHVFTRNAEEIHLCVGAEGKKKKEAMKKVKEALKNIDIEINGNEIVEVNLSAIIEKLPQPKEYDYREIDDSKMIYRGISVYPYVLRDIAVWVPEGIGEDDIEGLIKEKGGELQVRSDLFDEFSKDSRTSYAFHLVFQSKEKTLSDEEVNKIMKNIEDEVKKRGWEVR